MLRAGPTAMSDQNYLKEHPDLQAFLDSHPQIQADPRAFLSPVTGGYESRRSDFDMVMSYLVPFAVFVCVLLGFFWVLRTLLENRRWNRSFKVHEEVHGKLIEKFASGQDFSAYLQSDAGRRAAGMDSASAGLDFARTAQRRWPNPLVAASRVGVVPGGPRPADASRPVIRE